MGSDSFTDGPIVDYMDSKISNTLKLIDKKVLPTQQQTARELRSDKMKEKRLRDMVMMLERIINSYGDVSSILQEIYRRSSHIPIWDHPIMMPYLHSLNRTTKVKAL